MEEEKESEKEKEKERVRERYIYIYIKEELSIHTTSWWRMHWVEAFQTA